MDQQKIPNREKEKSKQKNCDTDQIFKKKKKVCENKDFNLTKIMQKNLKEVFIASEIFKNPFI